jgi:NAD(P)-dependent dehydrogenase (short-subunit alcohol dehydrogenase family)
MMKVALITAGGSGMGADAARRLAADGFMVGVLSSSGKGKALGETLGGFGVTGSNLDDAALGELVQGAVNRWGRVDVVVNSAGHGPKGKLLEITDADWAKGMDMYLMNVINAARIAAPVMVANGGGTILNISSFAAVEPSASFPTSAVARAALAAYSKLFADEYAAQNLRMNNILPGYIDSLPETEARRTAIPMGRYGRAEEVSAMVSYLSSDMASYVTGQNFRIDGGLTRSM